MSNNDSILKKAMRSKLVSVILAIIYALFILTFSIGLPLYIRPFYYAHIKPLGLENVSGKSYSEIVGAYNELLDYCVFGEPFGMGSFRYSEEGYSHFADCKVLFDLSGTVLIITSVLLIACLVIRLMTKKEFATLKGYTPSYWGSVVLLCAIAVVGVWGIADFDSLFVAFHTVFFPGKTNWYFNPYTDEIIKVMPWEFFRNCAIFIAVGVIALTTAFVINGVKRKKRG